MPPSSRKDVAIGSPSRDRLLTHADVTDDEKLQSLQEEERMVEEEREVRTRVIFALPVPCLCPACACLARSPKPRH